ncbi:hypothetical protein WA026_014326 [Henosepilachna vigintioctopunctata]|uniref:Tetratricopeptide repeat protein 21A/21B second ARM domain-containing protein n=1 Tax=Henosepilachna vigintioctopunctata TaxID=420089 RepID=A0AAW1UJV7_9CUCU
MICRNANYEEAVVCLNKYMSVFNKTEPKNATLLLETAILFSQISARNEQILQVTYSMVEQAAKNFPENSEIICELGFQCLLQNKFKEASKLFKTSTKIDTSSVKASVGYILTELEDNRSSSEIKDHIEHLLDMKGAQNSTITLLLKAKISETEEDAINCLNKASDQHLNTIKHFPYSDVFLRLLNPDLLLQIVNEYLKYIPFVSDLSFAVRLKPPDSSAVAVENILIILHKACPGMMEPLFLLAKLQYYIIGDISNAAANIELILERDNISSDAYILMAQIQIRNGMIERAAQSLEEGLSVDLNLKDNPMYHFINGVVQKKLNNLQDSIKSLTSAITIMNADESIGHPKNMNEKAAIFIELIDAHNQIGQVDEAMRLLEEATEELQKTPEESRIVLLCAELAVKHNNIQVR